MASSGTKNWRYLPKAYFSGLNFREYLRKYGQTYGTNVPPF